MTKELNIDEVVERARRAQENRLSVIQGLAEAQQNVTNVRADAAERIARIEAEANTLVADAERHHASEYQGAQRVGWSADELKSLGFTEPDKNARTRKRAARKPSTKTVQRSSESAQNEPTETPAG